MKKQVGLVVMLLCISLLTGCLYPKSEKAPDMSSLDLFTKNVEGAISLYHEQTGVYPIENSTVDTPIYEKYRIDMSKIYPRYLAYLPANAFENGGSHLYVLVDIETKPKVKLIDLGISSKVESVQRLVNQYKSQKGDFPFGEKNTDFTYELDFNKLKERKPELVSPFTGRNLPLLITDNGVVIVDYTLDIGIFLNQGHTYQGTDPREVLVQNTYFVPVKSAQYEMLNGELKLVNPIK